MQTWLNIGSKLPLALQGESKNAMEDHNHFCRHFETRSESPRLGGCRIGTVPSNIRSSKSSLQPKVRQLA